LVKKGLRLLILPSFHSVDQAHGPNDEAPGIDAVRLLIRRPEPFLCIEVRLHRGDNPFGDVILNVEDILHLTVVLFGPDVLPGLSVDQLASNTNTLASRADTALEHVPNPKVLGDLPDVHCLTFVNKGRIPRDDEEPAQTSQRRSDVLGNPVCEELLLGIAAHIGKWQNGDGWLIERLQG
jgi:hypothetical protein